MRRFVLLALFVALLLSLPSSFKRLTCGWKLAKVRLDLPYRPEWEIDSDLSQTDLHAILSQSFTYLDKGAQCYVFASADGEYVLKLFRYDPHRYTARSKRSNAKIAAFFSACKLAYEKAKEETALIYLHLNRTEHSLPLLDAKGPLGQSIHLPLDHYRFAIQRRVVPFRAALLQAYQSKDPTRISALIDSWIALLASRIHKKIGNLDPSLSRNFGFLDHRAIEIDFGNYAFPLRDPHGEMERYAKRFRRWLKHNAPEWVAYFNERLTACESAFSSS
jgi:hypothetical protein